MTTTQPASGAAVTQPQPQALDTAEVSTFTLEFKFTTGFRSVATKRSLTLDPSWDRSWAWAITKRLIKQAMDWDRRGKPGHCCYVSCTGKSLHRASPVGGVVIWKEVCKHLGTPMRNDQMRQWIKDQNLKERQH